MLISSSVVFIRFSKAKRNGAKPMGVTYSDSKAIEINIKFVSIGLSIKLPDNDRQTIFSSTKSPELTFFVNADRKQTHFDLTMTAYK